MFSPDGRWVAYSSAESGAQEVYITTYPQPSGKVQVSAGGGQYPRWRHDGRELFFLNLTGQLIAAPITLKGGGLDVGELEPLLDKVPVARGISYDVAADGQRFLVVDDGEFGREPLTLIQNWTVC